MAVGMQTRPTWLPVKTWEALPGYGNLYVLTRMLDVSGSGHVWVSVDWAAKQLGLKRRTVIDYVRRCHQYGLFRSIRWQGDFVHIYYSSLPKVACAYSGPGGCRVLVEPGEVKFKKAMIAEAVAKTKQNQSYYLQHKEQQAKQGTKKPRMNTLEQVFGSGSSHYAGGKSPVLRRTQRFTFVISEFPLFGASQPIMAAEINRHERTVRRRLSKQYRESLATRHQADLPPLNRAQLAIQTRLSPDALWFYQSQSFDAEHYFTAFGRVWRPACTLYWSELPIKGQRRLNHQISRLQQRGCSLPDRHTREA